MLKNRRHESKQTLLHQVNATSTTSDPCNGEKRVPCDENTLQMQTESKKYFHVIFLFNECCSLTYIDIEAVSMYRSRVMSQGNTVCQELRVYTCLSMGVFCEECFYGYLFWFENPKARGSFRDAASAELSLHVGPGSRSRA